MRELNIKLVWKRKFVNTTDSKYNQPMADNLLNCEFNSGAPNQAWLSDMAYISPQTAEARRAYREMIVTASGLDEAISGAIIYEETVQQVTRGGMPFAHAIQQPAMEVART